MTVVGLSNQVGPTRQPSRGQAAGGEETQGRKSYGEMVGQGKARCRIVVLDAVTGNTSMSDW